MASDNPVVKWNLDTTEENILNSFLRTFSFPDTVTYQGQGYNLTKAYDTFWLQFYDSSFCTDKFRKLPKPSLGNEALKSLARIIKRGWQDERYIPTKFSEIFLRSCFFGNDSLKDISAEMILDFVEDDKEVDIIKKLLDGKKNHVDNESLEVLKKYCSTGLISTSSTIEEACIGVVQQILNELDVIIQEWKKELEDLLDLKEFNFIMKQRKQCLCRSMGPPLNVYDDLTNFEEDLPHILWTTFFKGWTDDKIDFYFKMLVRNSVICACGGFGSKHLMGNDGSNCGVKVSTERHDWVLSTIKEKINEALSKEGTFFSSANDWIFLHQLYSLNDFYDWPNELEMGIEAKPHLLIYSMIPHKKVMIVEVSIMWEEWYKLSPDERIYKTKTKAFKSTVAKFKKNGFEVKFKDIEIGCRGVLSRQLYTLLKEDLRMDHGEVSRTMEEVSKEIVSLAYEEYLRKKPTEEPSRASLKRKIAD